METMMETSDNYKISFDYYLEYAVWEDRAADARQVFASRDVHESFRELLAVPDGARRTLQLLLKDPEGEGIVLSRAREMWRRRR